MQHINNKAEFEQLIKENNKWEKLKIPSGKLETSREHSAQR